MTMQEFKTIEEAMKSILDSGSTKKNRHPDCELKITYDDVDRSWIQFHHLNISHQMIDHEDYPDVIPEGWVGIFDNDNHYYLINENKVQSFEIWEN